MSRNNDYMKRYHKTLRGRVNQILNSQRSGSKLRGHTPPTYSVQELEDWMVGKGYVALYDQWMLSGFSKELMPSTDRLDDSKGYSFDNIRLVTWQENRDKAYADRKANILITAQHVKVNQFSKSGEFIQSFDSIESAARAVKGDSSNILKVCQGKPNYRTSKGYRWEFVRQP